MEFKLKKGLQQYLNIPLGLGIGTISMMIMVIVITAFRDSQTASTLAWNITNAALNLFSGVVSQFTTIGTIIGVLLLAAVVFAFGYGGYMVYNKMR